MEELDRGYQFIIGSRPILVIAAHNFRQGREGSMKAADMGTGDLARKICEKYKFYGLVSTRTQLDPNWYSSSNFREEVKEIIKMKDISLLIDLHGRSLAAKDLIELKANKIFKEKYSLKTGSFVDNKQLTLAEELDNTTPVIQIEIREDGRVPTIDEKKYAESWEDLNNLITKLYEN